jgi:hypothetical protein
LGFHYTVSGASLAERAPPALSARATPPILGAVADEVRAVLAFGLIAFRAQKQHLESSGS